MDFNSVTIGANSSNVSSYLSKIKSDVIETAQKALNDQQEALFTSFRANWHGQSEQNFENNFKIATGKVYSSLDQHYSTLSAKIWSVNNSWIQQDANMVSTKGGY